MKIHRLGIACSLKRPLCGITELQILNLRGKTNEFIETSANQKLEVVIVKSNISQTVRIVHYSKRGSGSEPSIARRSAVRRIEGLYSVLLFSLKDDVTRLNT